MRVRGSSLCDVAVLMVDLMNGLQGQTIESLKMVNRSKTKFVIGLNKCDLISEWVAYPGKPFQYALKQQTRVVQDRFAERLALVCSADPAGSEQEHTFLTRVSRCELVFFSVSRSARCFLWILSSN